MDRAAWHSRVNERHRQLAWRVRCGVPAVRRAQAGSLCVHGGPRRAWGAAMVGAELLMGSVDSAPNSGIGVRHRALTAHPYLPHNKRAHARQMPAKLKFRVVHASSEDPEFPSTELNAHSPHTVPSPLPPADRKCARVGARCRCEENPAGHGARWLTGGLLVAGCVPCWRRWDGRAGDSANTHRSSASNLPGPFTSCSFRCSCACFFCVKLCARWSLPTPA